MAAAVDRRPVTLAAPLQAPSADGPSVFYSHLSQELARILAACGGHAAAHSSSQPGFGHAAVPGDQVTPPTTDAAAVSVVDSARQLETELERLWRLDTSILRTADTADMLDAPPMLAPGPHVTGTGSAAVRLKQLRAAFVARSQQVNMAHNRYKCLSKHNDLYKTYVRTSSDSMCLSSPRSTVSPPPGEYSSHTSSASETDTTATLSTGGGLGSANGSLSAMVSWASSIGASDVAETVHHKPASPTPHVVPDSYATLMDVDPAPCGSTGSAAVSEPDSPPARGSASRHTTSDAEVPQSRDSSPPLRSRSRGFLGLGALFGRARQPESPPKMPAPVMQQVPPTIQEEDAAVPEVRRSFSEPSVISRRGALELSRESLETLCARRGFAMDGDDSPGPSQRRSREAKRSGETLRSKSEPASMTRDARRRRNFFMETADEDEEDDDPREHFINTDLENRVQIFSSETQLYRGEDNDESFDFSRRRR